MLAGWLGRRPAGAAAGKNVAELLEEVRKICGNPAVRMVRNESKRKK